MRFQKQTEHGVGGNCLSACLASLMGIPLSEIPNFSHGIPDGVTLEEAGRIFCENYAKWLRGKGFWNIELIANEETLKGWGISKDVLLLGTYRRVQSNILHACIINGIGEIVFDPAVIPADTGPMVLESIDLLMPNFIAPTTLLYGPSYPASFGHALVHTPG